MFVELEGPTIRPPYQVRCDWQHVGRPEGIYLLSRGPPRGKLSHTSNIYVYTSQPSNIKKTLDPL